MRELFLESTIIQGLVTLILVCAVVYLNVTGGQVSDELVQALFTVIGFWFGSKTNLASKQVSRLRSNKDG